MQCPFRSVVIFICLIIALCGLKLLNDVSHDVSKMQQIIIDSKESQLSLETRRCLAEFSEQLNRDIEERNYIDNSLM